MPFVPALMTARPVAAPVVNVNGVLDSPLGMTSVAGLTPTIEFEDSRGMLHGPTKPPRKYFDCVVDPVVRNGGSTIWPSPLSMLLVRLSAGFGSASAEETLAVTVRPGGFATSYAPVATSQRTKISTVAPDAI